MQQKNDSTILLLDLWQEQMRMSMQDERYLDAMLDMMLKMQQTATPATAAGFPYAPDASHSEAASAAPDARASELGLLAQRVALCERRIAELEARLAERAPGSAPPP